MVLSLLVALVGLLIWLLLPPVVPPGDARRTVYYNRAAEVARIMFFTGLLAYLLSAGTRVITH